MLRRGDNCYEMSRRGNQLRCWRCAWKGAALPGAWRPARVLYAHLDLDAGWQLEALVGGEEEAGMVWRRRGHQLITTSRAARTCCAAAAARADHEVGGDFLFACAHE